MENRNLSEIRGILNHEKFKNARERDYYRKMLAPLRKVTMK